MFKTRNFIAGACAAAIGLGLVAQASGAPAESPGAHSAGNAAGVAVLERADQRFQRSVEVQHARSRYRSAYDAAREAGVHPPRNPLADRARPATLLRQAKRLERRANRRDQGASGPGAIVAPEQYGISQGTLDAVASCESGGDPAAVSADGTYRGKYQFDYGTWASVGGSGDPAAAPEAEQDMRAAMLYSRAGSNPWPICG